MRILQSFADWSHVTKTSQVFYLEVKGGTHLSLGGLHQALFLIHNLRAKRRYWHSHLQAGYWSCIYRILEVVENGLYWKRLAKPHLRSKGHLRLYQVTKGSH